MQAELWVVVEAVSGRIIGAWPDVYTAKGAMLAREEEAKVDCMLLQGVITYGRE